ncbi:hypothetical protein SDC9_71085 [bioreactor metagenome]|uniref:Tail specific protease domain-containing protein n=1 Tax=bioreactor metagenome TaxID=1076179 RepID=A0A644Y7M6_9ZZZZ|nr:S41 family peptidase [Candidatus Metalachnospira sp.]
MSIKNILKKNNSNFTEAEKYNRMKKAVITLSAVVGVLAASLAFIVYTNYDYLVFKTMLTRGYIYQDSVSELIDDELEQDDSDVSTYFDDAVINIFLNRLYDVSGDRYTYLYLPYQYTNRVIDEEETGKSCEWIPFNQDTAYMKITNFSDESADFVKENSEELSKYSNIVIDLRGNGGGYVTSVKEIADMFLDKGETISSEKALIGAFSRENVSKNDAVFNFNKIIILQDGETASASEILIGALRDNLKNVTLLGTTTFGKGIGQTTIPLTKGFYLKATAFSWATPDGSEIQGKGIQPDYEFSLEKLNSILEEE